MFFSRKAPIQKRRRRRKAVAIRVCPSSNHVSCSESAIKIYGSKEEIRLQKSPETVDAPGFTPDASIPVTLYGPRWETRTPNILLPNRNRKLFPDVSNGFLSFPLVFRYSRDLFGTPISACSVRVCSNPCGQKRFPLKRTGSVSAFIS